MKCTKMADLLQSLSMYTPEFALSQLLEHKLFVSSDTNVDLVFLVVRVVFDVWLFGMYENSYAIIHKNGLLTLSLRYEREYSSNCV